jgi:hypothetical protein
VEGGIDGAFREIERAIAVPFQVLSDRVAMLVTGDYGRKKKKIEVPLERLATHADLSLPRTSGRTTSGETVPAGGAGCLT